MVQRNRVFRVKIRQPAETVTQRPALLFWLPDVLVKALQRSDGEPAGRELPRFAHHLSLVGPVAVQRDEERAGCSGRWSVEIIVELDFGFERKVYL